MSDYEYPDQPLIRPPQPHYCRRFEGKVVLLTGATKGMGLAMATRFAEEGAKVVLSSRKQDQVDEQVKILRARGLSVAGKACHQGRAADREALIKFTVQTYGKIDSVALCVGIQPAPATGPTLEVPSAIYDKIFDTNVKSFWSFVQEVLPHLQPRANFLFVSSMGAYSPSPPLGLYGVSKTALVALTKLLANELGAQGIRVNCVAPGIIRTRFAEMLWRKLPDGTLPLALRGVHATSYLHRAGEPHELAGVAAFLCSDDASYITGETLVVNGGGGSRL